ncbi:MAG: transketolase [Planctomycetes bacterium]|nr:transketolase [Planctomycetota bacterium]
MTVCTETIDRAALEAKCREIRLATVREIADLGVGHAGGSMSIIEVLVVLYERHMRVDPADPKKPGRDRFVLSKGHSGPALYAVLADKGFFDPSWLKTLNRPGTRLPSHPDVRLTPGVDMTTGSLGQGLSCAVGIAIGSKLRRDGARVYAIIGDGESDEGQIWEAAMLAGNQGLDNLIAFTDYNHMMIDGETHDIMNLDPLPDKWQAFGWRTWVVDGHDVVAIDAAIGEAKATSGKPCMIIMNTMKGKGVSFLEATRLNNHNVTITADQLAVAVAELGGADNV